MCSRKVKCVGVILVLLFFIVTGAQASATEVASSSGETPEQSGKWDKAGQEISEAAAAVGQASGESWNKTKDATEKSYEEMKEKSAEAWSKTKEQSGEIVDKTVDAAEDAADSAAAKSEEVWSKTKEESAELVDKAKAKVHEMSAPETE